ncbi:hypothetical protein GCM10022403_077730 [Streptomyces coacervatus]|uniref:Uncharacterized protein n=1 Tax=Streptomyces coacervatus TaxID=647381 RepID=A0ABP7J3Q4_9ACTN|nr:hypothetical protein [Streptomyces coacervatus]MDF2272460.1 hypothetical protein [Streptomyces coacervatus]
MSISSSSPQSNDRPIAVAHDDPFSTVVHAAVNDRPLEEVANLITMLEQSPQYATATTDALRAVGKNRSVEDVARLVTLLTRPPRDAASADEAIRAAVENRPVEEVTRLMAQLHRTSKECHFGQEAARAAASTRSVEDLVELIGRLGEERTARATVPEAWPQARPHGEKEWGPDGAIPPPVPPAPPSFGPGTVLGRPARAPARHAERPPWPGLLVAAALFLCALLWFPMYQTGEPVQIYVTGVAVSALCALLAVLVTLRPVPLALAVAGAVPALLAGVELYRGRLHSAWLSQALDLTLAPGWVAGLAAMCAALAALTALVLRIAAHPSAMGAAARPLAAASRPE